MLVSNKHGLGAREGHLYGKGIYLHGRISVLGTAVDRCDARGLVLPEIVAVHTRLMAVRTCGRCRGSGRST
jgi:hypothetical protein